MSAENVRETSEQTSVKVCTTFSVRKSFIAAANRPNQASGFVQNE